MNDVSISNPGLKLGRPSDQSSVAASNAAREMQSAGASGTAPLKEDARLKQVNAVASETAGPGLGDRGRLDKAISQLNDYVQSVQRDLQFEVDNELGKTIVKVVDQETQEIIRQIPDEVALKLAEKLQQSEPLTLFQIKV